MNCVTEEEVICFVWKINLIRPKPPSCYQFLWDRLIRGFASALIGTLLVEGGIGRRISRGVPKLSRTTELSKKRREAPESIGFSEW